MTQDGSEHSVDKWDMLIAHPPCTYMSNAGACRMYRKDRIKVGAEEFRMMCESRLKKMILARDFFLAFYNSDIEKICIENPIPMRISMLPEKTQVVQPYEYGHPYTKKTYLWIKGMEKLCATNIVKPIGGYVCGNAEIWKRQAAQGCVVGKEKSAKHRSKTFPGIAKAMAEQWG